MEVKQKKTASVTYHIWQGLVVQGEGRGVGLHHLLNLLGDHPQVSFRETPSTESCSAFLVGFLPFL